MVFSTLGGGLTAIDPVTSEIRWTIADGNYAGTPKSAHFHGITPIFQAQVWDFRHMMGYKGSLLSELGIFRLSKKEVKM